MSQRVIKVFGILAPQIVSMRLEGYEYSPGSAPPQGEGGGTNGEDHHCVLKRSERVSQHTKRTKEKVRNRAEARSSQKGCDAHWRAAEAEWPIV